MALKCGESVKDIINIFISGKLFESDLGKKNFKIFIEILNNAKRKKLKKCFSRRSRKGLQKHSRLVRKLSSKKISTKKRMKLLRNSGDSFRRVVRKVITDFMTRCCESDSQNAL